MVAHHPEIALGDLHGAELLVGLIGPIAIDVGLVQRFAVDRHAPLGVAAGDRVAPDGDHPLDEVLVVGPEPKEVFQVAKCPADNVGRLRQRRRVLLETRAVDVEDDDLPALHIAEVVDHLVDQHPVVDLERLLHRPGRNVERLHHKALDEQRQHQSDDDQHGDLAAQRPFGLGTLLGLGGTALPPVTRGCSGSTRWSREPSGLAYLYPGAVGFGQIVLGQINRRRIAVRATIRSEGVGHDRARARPGPVAPPPAAVTG